MKKYFYEILTGLVLLLGFGGIALGAQPALTVFQGGTGTTTPSGILIGDNGATPRLSTLTIGSNLTLTGTTLSAAGGSGTFPFTPSAFFNSTSTLIQFGAGIFASSTSLFGPATTTFQGDVKISTTSKTALNVRTNAGVTNFNIDNTNTTGALFGIGSTSPWASVSIHANDGDTNTTLFAIGSSTATATTTLFTVNNVGLASTSNLLVSAASGTGTRCAQFAADGTVSAAAAACGTGGFAWPFTPGTFGSTVTSATSTVINDSAGFVSLASSTLANLTILFSTTTNATTSELALVGSAKACNTTNALTTSAAGNVTCTAQPQGTVTAISIASANGFGGSSGGGATPALTITTSVTGLLLGNATAVSAFGGTSCTFSILSLSASGGATCGGFGWPYTPTNNFNVITSATSTAMSFLQGFNASSTVRIGDALKPLAFFFGGTNIGIGSTTPSPLWGIGLGTTTQIGAAQFVEGSASSTAAAATYTANWDTGNTYKVDLTQATVIVINATSSNPLDNGHYILKLCQDGTGSRAVTFATPGQLRWWNGTTTVTATANKCTYIGMIYDLAALKYDVVASSTNVDRR